MTEPAIEQLWKDAVRQHLASLSAEEVEALLDDARKPPVGTHVPGVGNTPHQRGSVEGSAIQAAESAGDWQRAFALKAQQLGRIMRKP